MTRNVLFLCSQNRLRSPTAEQVFADWPGIESAPHAPHAPRAVTLTLPEPTPLTPRVVGRSVSTTDVQWLPTTTGLPP